LRLEPYRARQSYCTLHAFVRNCDIYIYIYKLYKKKVINNYYVEYNNIIIEYIIILYLISSKYF